MSKTKTEKSGINWPILITGILSLVYVIYNFVKLDGLYILPWFQTAALAGVALILSVGVVVNCRRPFLTKRKDWVEWIVVGGLMFGISAIGAWDANELDRLWLYAVTFASLLAAQAASTIRRRSAAKWGAREAAKEPHKDLAEPPCGCYSPTVSKGKATVYLAALTLFSMVGSARKGNHVG